MYYPKSLITLRWTQGWIQVFGVQIWCRKYSHFLLHYSLNEPRNISRQVSFLYFILSIVTSCRCKNFGVRQVIENPTGGGGIWIHPFTGVKERPISKKVNFSRDLCHFCTGVVLQQHGLDQAMLQNTYNSNLPLKFTEQLLNNSIPSLMKQLRCNLIPCLFVGSDNGKNKTQQHQFRCF